MEDGRAQRVARKDGRSEVHTPRVLAFATGVRHSLAVGARARPERDLHERLANLGVDGRGVDGRVSSGDAPLAEGEEEKVLRVKRILPLSQNMIRVKHTVKTTKIVEDHSWLLYSRFAPARRRRRAQ